MLVEIISILMIVFFQSHQEDRHRFVPNGSSVVYIKFDKEPTDSPVIRTEMNIFRYCRDISMDLIKKEDNNYTYRKVVSSTHIESATILFGSYWSSEKRLSIALVPNDTVYATVVLDTNKSIKSYKFKGKNKSLCEYYQAKSIHVNYIDPLFQKPNCTDCNWDSVVNQEKSFILSNAKKYNLSPEMIKEELALSKINYFGYNYHVPDSDFKAMRLNDFFLGRTVLTISQNDSLNIDDRFSYDPSKSGCPFPGGWSLLDRFSDIEHVLKKISTSSRYKSNKDELALFIMIDIVIPKLKNKSDLKLFPKLLEYISYQPYKSYLEDIIEEKTISNHNLLIKDLLDSKLLNKKSDFIILLKSKYYDIPDKNQDKFRILAKNKILIELTVENGKIYNTQLNYTYNITKKDEEMFFCCDPTFIAFNSKNKISLKTRSITSVEQFLF